MEDENIDGIKPLAITHTSKLFVEKVIDIKLPGFAIKCFTFYCNQLVENEAVN